MGFNSAQVKDSISMNFIGSAFLSLRVDLSLVWVKWVNKRVSPGSAPPSSLQTPLHIPKKSRFRSGMGSHQLILGRSGLIPNGTHFL